MTLIKEKIRETIVRHGVEVAVTNEYGEPGTWSVFFSRPPGNSHEIVQVPPLCGLQSKEQALEAGKKFVDERQKRFICNAGDYEVFVRLRWDGLWGYVIKNDWDKESSYRSTSPEEAEQAARKRVAAKIKEDESV